MITHPFDVEWVIVEENLDIVLFYFCELVFSHALEMIDAHILWIIVKSQ